MNAQAPAVIEPGYHSVIVRLAEAGKLDELERFVRLQEEWQRSQDAREERQALREFTDAKAAVEAKINQVVASTPNPQTRRKYASFAAVDGAARPHYTEAGFAVSFNTEPGRNENEVLVVGYLQKGSIKERYQIFVPVEVTGIKGGQATTRTWATMSAVTYGRRNLLIMMFNVAIADQDDDGRAAGGQTLKGGDVPQQQQQPLEPVPPPHDPQTGELLPPHTLPEVKDELWLDWARRFDGAVKGATTEAQIDEWLAKNKQSLDMMKTRDKGQPETYSRLEAQINKHRNHIKMQKDKK